MAIKVRLTFYAYDNGKEVNHTNTAAFVNSIDEAEAKAKETVAKEYPDAKDMRIILNKKFLEYGGWIVAGISKTDPDRAFLLVINKLQ